MSVGVPILLVLIVVIMAIAGAMKAFRSDLDRTIQTAPWAALLLWAALLAIGISLWLTMRRA